MPRDHDSGSDEETLRSSEWTPSPDRSETGGDGPNLQTGGALGGPLADRLIDSLSLELIGDSAEEARKSIGPYRVVRPLGEGGMGAVFLAEQTEPVRRQVAIKLIRPGMLDRRSLYRFEAERQALARMSHPYIAQVYDAGTTSGGAPFTVMEYIRGETITSYCDARRLDLTSRIELFEVVCQGVQHAHEKGVLHRDLKPSNILVEEHQGHPKPKIIDFGIAKAFDQPLTEAGALTGEQIIGTPAYMSPEAITAAGDGTAVGTRSDIYSLGVLLSQLLIGVLPHPKTSGFFSMARQIVENDAPAPSRRLARLPLAEAIECAAARSTSHPALVRSLRGDLDAIVLKAIARDQGLRYASAEALAEDLVLHRRHEPVSAGPQSGMHRTVKFARRNLLVVATLALLAISILVGATVAAINARRANQQAMIARKAQVEADEVASFLVDLFRASDPWSSPRPEQTIAALLAEGARRAEDELEDQPRIHARLLAAIGDVYRSQGRFDEAEPLLVRSLAIFRDVAGDESLEAAQGLFDLGRLYRDQGSFDRAGDALRQSLRIREARLGPDHVAVADVLYSLGFTTLQRGSYATAEPLLLRSLEIRESSLPAESLEIATSLNGLGGLYLYQRRLEEAEPTYRRSLAIRRTVLGEAHPAVAMSLNNLGRVVLERGDPTAAEALTRQALEIDRQALGEDHPYVAMNLANIAEILWRQGRLDEGEELFLECLELRRRILGEDHPSLAFVYHGLARIHRDSGDLELAANFFVRAIDLWETQLLPGSRDYQLALEEYAEVLGELGRSGDARLGS